MPTARIITTASQHTGQLAKELLARGYEILNAESGDATAEADLEITMRECTADQASTITSGLPSGKDLRVFVSPGALAGSVRSIELFVVAPKDAAVCAPERIVFESTGLSREEMQTQVTAQSAVQEQTVVAPQPKQESSVRSQTAQVPDTNPDLVPHGMIWQALPSTEAADSTETNPAVPVAMQETRPARQLRNEQRFWNTAAFAGALAVLVLATFLFSHRVPPLSPRASKPVSPTVHQTLPFQAPTPVSTQASVTEPQIITSVSPTAKQKRSPMQGLVMRTSNNESVTAGSHPDSDYVAADTVVVRVGNSQKNTARTINGVKHISDVN